MLRTGSPGHFRIVRDFLVQRYSPELVAAALGVPSVGQFDQRQPGRPINDAIVRLLFGGAPITEGHLRASAPPTVLEAMMELGLLARAGDALYCPVLVYPFDKLHLVSDRFSTPEGEVMTPDREFVYFALTHNTQNYIASLPERRCSNFLDVGAGCGAAALMQARWADRACSADISSRCSLYAEFNRRLNGIENVEVVEGSLYDPVECIRFDRIGCHPPYDVGSTANWTFADGGDDGEFVIRGVIAGLPKHLTEGGQFVGLARAADTVGRPLELRMRDWLGPEHEQFDIAIVVRATSTLEDYALTSVLTSTRDMNDYTGLLRRFEQLKFEQLVYASILIERKTDKSAAVTLRREFGRQCRAAELEWLLGWERSAAKQDLNGFIFEPSAAMEMIVHHRYGRNALNPEAYEFRVSEPFKVGFEAPQWIALLVGYFDGLRTTEQVYTMMRQNGPIEPDQFAGAVKRLVGAGVLRAVRS